MSCLFTLVANAICLIAPSELTLRADVSMQIAGDVKHWNDGHDYRGGHMGRVQLDMPLVIYRGFTLTAGYEHLSLIDTPRDRGEERAFVGLTWRPFR